MWNLREREEGEGGGKGGGVSSASKKERSEGSAHLRSVLNQCNAIAENPNETDERGSTLAAKGRLVNAEKTLFSKSCAAS